METRIDFRALADIVPSLRRFADDLVDNGDKAAAQAEVAELEREMGSSTRSPEVLRALLLSLMRLIENTGTELGRAALTKLVPWLKATGWLATP
jgi:hypothetical protein